MLCRASLVSAFLPLLGACAGSMPKEAPSADGVAAIQLPTSASGQEGKEVAAMASGPDDEFAVDDPWERFNRPMHRFNSYADKYVIRPLGVAYDWATPTAVQNSVTRMLANLGE